MGPLNERPKGPAEQAFPTNVSLGVVSAVVGITMFAAVDTPWAGTPLLFLGVFFLAKTFRDVRRERSAPGDEGSERRR